jgi:hypothetical protein
MDIFFTAIFAFELCLVIYAHWLMPFFSDGWCDDRASARLGAVAPDAVRFYGLCCMHT